MNEDGSQGEPETLSERPNRTISDDLPDGERVEISIQGYGTYAIRNTEERPSGEIYVEWWSIHEIADQEEYTSEDAEERLVFDPETGIYETYVRGTQNPLYVGTDVDAAQDSLEYDDEQWNSLISSDPT